MLTNVCTSTRILSVPQASCLLDPGCLTLLSCPANCAGDSFVEGLCAFECGEAGLRWGKICFESQTLSCRQIRDISGDDDVLGHSQVSGGQAAARGSLCCLQH